ncbi:GNAT family N-acetyltransferase [Actinocrinis puniceicyclus]|uniref:GNAT family N-acetyltransferase n=1 Tax=Actinocrinis puniceicyclus TaxID=977794 RepID=A0A8J8BDM7_9ACTN|nr:GNAT family N-acetyltransferase [Actinocrinis puniceicyclus]MBS2964326.1 GNAT family N-acetyltransferase [Actinocrinis puniceicyclus]
MITIEPVPVDDEELAKLRQELRADISARYPDVGADSDEHLTDDIRFLLMRENGTPIGCCALQPNRASGLEGLELKRMYVVPTSRGTTAAGRLLAAAEALARRLGAPRIYLETGTGQPEAIRFYERSGYTTIPLYPPYIGSPLSVSYEKAFEAG